MLIKSQLNKENFHSQGCNSLVPETTKSDYRNTTLLDFTDANKAIQNMIFH